MRVLAAELDRMREDPASDEELARAKENAKGRLVLGDHPRLQGIRDLGVGAKPTFTAFFSEGTGALDDHFESWFLSFDNPPSTPPEGLESVVGLGLAEDWLDPPTAEH